MDFAKAFKAKDLTLDCLVNNAGVFLVPHDFTQEGFETVVGTNYFGPFLLTHLLLDKLRDSAPSRYAHLHPQKVKPPCRNVAAVNESQLIGSR